MVAACTMSVTLPLILLEYNVSQAAGSVIVRAPPDMRMPCQPTCRPDA